MHVVAVETADPVREVGAAAHALCVCEEIEGFGAVGETGGFDVCDFLAGRDDGFSDVGEADGAYFGGVSEVKGRDWTENIRYASWPLSCRAASASYRLAFTVPPNARTAANPMTVVVYIITASALLARKYCFQWKYNRE